MPVILDTDILSLLQRRRSPEFYRLQARLVEVPTSDVWVTIVSFEEQLRGRMAYLRQSRADRHLLSAYAKLFELLEEYFQLHVVRFDEAALLLFHDLREQRIRIGTMDLRIAAVASSHGATVITRNMRDFEKVPGLKVEDWTS